MPHSLNLLFMILLLMCCGCASDSVITAEAFASADKLPRERPYLLGGKLDAGNLYPNAVMLLARLDPKHVGECSGAVISPRRILTAAHCVCMETPVTSSSQGAKTMIDGSICLKRVTIVTALYGSTTPEKSYTGVKIEPHPELALLYDAAGNVISAESDLAVIHLESALPGIQSVELTKMEVEPGSAVALVGFGDTNLGDKPSSGKRYFGRTEVSLVAGELLKVLKPGTHAFRGDSGGPCFTWEPDKASPVLAGIIRGGGASIYSSITSITFPRNRRWLEKIIRKDTQADAGASP